MGRLILVLTSALLVAAVVVACGGSSSSGSTTPPAGSTSASSSPSGSSGEAAQLFADNCARCHGANGEGGSGPALTGEDDTAFVRQTIETGVESMPAFSGTLTSAQIDALAQYVTGGLQ